MPSPAVGRIFGLASRPRFLRRSERWRSGSRHDRRAALKNAVLTGVGFGTAGTRGVESLKTVMRVYANDRAGTVSAAGSLSVAFYRYFVIALNCLRAALPLGPGVFDARSRQRWI